MLHGHSQAHELLSADKVVLCTGYAYQMPECLKEINFF